MTRGVLASLLAVSLCPAVIAAQPGATAGQSKAAAAEVPRLVELLEIAPGMTVADIGAGFGAWSAGFARAVGATGRVYATEIGANQLKALKDLVARDSLTNVTVIEGAATATNLPAACCDAILIRDAYHHFKKPDDLVRSVAASLKPGGRLAIIDFPPRANSSLPDGVPSTRGGHGVPPDVVQREVGAVLTHVRTITDWGANGPSSSLFLVLFRKP
jgi:predicted methyltransferase